MTRLALRRCVAAYGAGPLALVGLAGLFAGVAQGQTDRFGYIVFSGLVAFGVALVCLASSRLRAATGCLGASTLGVGGALVLALAPLLGLMSVAVGIVLQRALVEGLVVPGAGGLRRPVIEVVAGGAVVLGALGIGALGIGAGPLTMGEPPLSGDGLWLRGVLVGVGAMGALGVMLALERVPSHRPWLARAALLLALTLVVVGVELQRRWVVGAWRGVSPWVAPLTLWWWSLPMTGLVLVLLVQEERR